MILRVAWNLLSSPAMNVAETIETLGGTGVLAAEVGVGPSAVRHWRRINAFPPRLYLKIADIGLGRGVVVDRALFRELSVAKRP